MKKLIALLLVLTMSLFAFVGCTKEEPAEAPVAEEPATDEPATDEPATEEPVTEEPATSEEPATEGEGATLEGPAEGFGGEVKVIVTKNGDDIVEVVAVGDSETNGIGSNAIEQLPTKIAEADSTEVEVVSGATVTSNAIIEAVNNALAAAE